MAAIWDMVGYGFLELALDLDSRHLEMYEKPKNRDSKWSESRKNQFSIPLFQYDLSSLHPKIVIFFIIVSFEYYLL